MVGVKTVVWGCGANDHSQLGAPELNSQWTPKPIPYFRNEGMVRVACGGSSSFTLSGQGEILAWGKNSHGQLGTGKTSKTPKPTKAKTPRGHSVVFVEGGWEHSAAIGANGMVYTFGSNSDGQLGHRPTGKSAKAKLESLAEPSPVVMPWDTKLASRFVAVACGMAHTLVCTDSGDVWAMGWGEYGQLGNGNTHGGPVPTKTLIPPSQKVTKVACGMVHSAALTASGQVFTWGWGEYGQLGHSTPAPAPSPSSSSSHTDLEGRVANNVSRPTRVESDVLGGVDVVFADAGAEHTLLLTSSGRVVAFGANDHGQCGVGDTFNLFKPQHVVKNIAKCRIIDLACGCDHSLLLSDMGDVWCMGSSEYGQLGLGDTKSHTTPHRITALSRSHRVIKIAAGLGHSAAITEDGMVFTWGWGKAGQLGHSQARGVSTPTMVEALRGKTAVQVACGARHTLVLSDEGEVFSFGSNVYGQLGLGTLEESPGVHTIAFAWGGDDLHVRKVKSVAAGMHISMALTHHGTVYVWGRGGCGQLGVLDLARSPVPTLISSLEGETIEQISAGYAHCLAVSENGEVCYSWGLGDNGQLGHGDTLSHHTPQGIAGLSLQQFDGDSAVSGLPQIRRVCAGGAHSVVIDSRGEVLVFGSGASGALGLGHLNYLTVPMLLESALGWKVVDIDCGGDFTAFVTANGSLYMFGRNSNGQLGMGDTDHRFVPTRVQALRQCRVVRVVCGLEYTIALTEDMQVWAWGRNSDGQLGLGTNQDALLPQRVQALTNFRVMNVACGASHTLFLVNEQPYQAKSRVTPRPSQEVQAEEADAVTLVLPQEKGGILADYLQLVNNKEFSDLHLKVGSSVVYAHQLILNTRAPHFVAVLQQRAGKSLLPSPQGPKEFVIDFCSRETLVQLLEFLYTGQVEMSSDGAVKLMLAADVAKARSLVRLCEDSLAKLTDVNNCVQYFHAALQTSAPRLEATAIAVIMDNFDRLSSASAFDEVPRDTMLRILELRSKHVSHM